MADKTKTPAPAKPKATKTKKPRNLATKLAGIMANIDSVEKRGKNKEQGYWFVRAADIANLCRMKLAAENIIVVADEVDRVDGSFETLKGTIMHTVQLKVEYTIIDGDSGERLVLHGWGDAFDTSDKAVNKCKTAALKYALRTMFLIPDDSDPEADESVGQASNQRTAEPFSKQQQTQQQVETVTCEKCNNPIGSFKKMKNGEVVEIIPAQKVVAASKINHAGKTYCGNCQIKLAKEKGTTTTKVDVTTVGAGTKKKETVEVPDKTKKKAKKTKPVDPNDIITIVPKDVKPQGRKYKVIYDLKNGNRAEAGCWSSTIAGILRDHIDENCDVVIKTTTKGDIDYNDITDILKAGEYLVEDGELVVRHDKQFHATDEDLPPGLFGHTE